MSGATAQEFLFACGASEAIRFECRLSGMREIEHREFGQPFVIAGRRPEADFVIDHPEVSRAHAYFQVVAGRLFCIDLNSRTGTYSGKTLSPAAWVSPSVWIRCGPARVRPVRSADSEPPNDAETRPGSRNFELPTCPESALVLSGVASERTSWRVRKALTLIGRTAACKVVLNYPGISRCHASLVNTPSGTWVVDLLSGTGVHVNGKRVRFARMEEGDELRVGPCILRIHPGLVPKRPASLLAPESSRRDLARASRPGQAPEPIASPPAVVVSALEPFADHREPVSPLVERLLDEFGRVHGETVRQYEQTLMMMFQMHQEQIKSLHEMIERLCRTGENQPTSQATPVIRPPLLAEADRPALRLIRERCEGPSEPPGLPVPREAEHGARTNGSVVVPTRVAGEPTSSVPEGVTDDAAHVFLSEKIAAIREERQGRWRRIIDRLIGDGLAEQLP